MKHSVSAQTAAINDQRPTEYGVPHRMGAAKWLRLFALSIINLLIALLWLSLLAWLIGRILTDRFAWSQWLWWIPTPAALIAAALGLLFAFRRAATRARRRRRILLWTACFFGLLIDFTTFEHRLLHSTPARPQRRLVIAHWNTTLETGPGNRGDASHAALLRAVQSLDSDILVLTSPPADIVAALDATATSPAKRLHALNLWPLYLRTRLPILHIHEPVATAGVFIMVVELDATAQLGRPITLYLVDLPSNPRLPRMPMMRDARRLVDKSNLPPPDIVMGDFNIPRHSASIAALFPGLRDAYDNAGHGYGATFPRRMPLYHIDHVLINESAGLQALRYDIIDQGVARHCAQQAWVAAK